jgi:hypothetical protein
VNALVDDQCLSLILRGEALSEVDGYLDFTTGYWHFRLCQVYFRSTSTGVLSRPFEGLDELERSAAERKLLRFPDEVGLINLRELVPLMAQLADAHPNINLLGREALAATLALEAKVVLATSFPTLESALESYAREWIIVGAKGSTK